MISQSSYKFVVGADTYQELQEKALVIAQGFFQSDDITVDIACEPTPKIGLSKPEYLYRAHVLATASEEQR